MNNQCVGPFSLPLSPAQQHSQDREGGRERERGEGEVGVLQQAGHRRGLNKPLLLLDV